MPRLRGKGPLSPRENQIIALVIEGHNNESIGHQLGITYNTVRVHLSRIYEKKGWAGRVDMVVAILRDQQASADLQSH